MVMTSDVLRFSIPSMLLNMVMPSNQLRVEVGRASENEGVKTTFVMLALSLFHSGELVGLFKEYVLPSCSSLLPSHMKVSVCPSGDSMA